MKKNITIGIIVALLIPVILNFLLPIKTGLNVIHQNDYWLCFWGTYLSACGSFIVALVSYKMNINANKINEQLQYDAAWQRLVERYNRLENFIVEQEKIHHTNWIDINEDKRINLTEHEYRLFLHDKEIELYSAGLLIRRYLENDNADEFEGNSVQKDFYAYGCSLAHVNNLFIDYYSFLIEGNMDESEVYARDIMQKFSGLVKSGEKLLQSEKHRLLKYGKDNNVKNAIL